MIINFIKTFVFSTALISLAINAQPSLEKLQGAWLGKMQIPDGPTLSVGVEIFKKADGNWGGNIASLDQGVRYMPVSTVELTGNVIKVQLANAPVSITGTVGDNLSSIDSEFKQGDSAFKLALSKVTALPEVERQQDVKATTEYLQQEVIYMNKSDGTWLSGTLTLPGADKKYPAVMLIAGSGPSHRDSYVAGHRPFKVMADHLTRLGYVVLRSDKRGVYKSAGSFKDSKIENYAKDTQAAVAYLKSHPNVDPTRIALIGHSEGSVTAAMTANFEEVKGIVSMAGPGMSVLDVLLLQDQTEPAATGASKTETDILLGFSKKFYDIVLNTDTSEDRKTKLQALYDNLQGKEAKVVNQWNNRSGTLNVDSASNDSFKIFLKENPLQYWGKNNISVLVLNGDKDAQVPAEENVKGIVKALAKTKSVVQQRIFSGINHMFQKATTGATTEYGEIEESINSEVLNEISKWLKAEI